METTLKVLQEQLPNVIRAGLVPNILGSPGIGKSAVVHHLADLFNLELIDIRLSQCDPTDLLGFPEIKNGRSSYALPEDIPLEGDPIPEGKDGWLIFFDEANAAPLSVQVASYKIINDKKVGTKNIHPNVAMVCAGNLATDKAVTNRISTALQSRLVHFQIVVSAEEWLDYANTAGIDVRVTSFIEFRKQLLHSFDPNHTDLTFPCPRTWSFVSKYIENIPTLTFANQIVIAGIVGEGAAAEFKNFCEIFESLPKVKDILEGPDSVHFDNSPSTLYAVSGVVSHEVTEDNIDRLVAFVNRLPIEFQVLTWKTVLKRKPELISTPTLKKWVKDNAKEI